MLLKTDYSQVSNSGCPFYKTERLMVVSFREVITRVTISLGTRSHRGRPFKKYLFKDDLRVELILEIYIYTVCK